MNLQKSVLQRLLLAKDILSPARSLPGGHPSAHVVAQCVLNAHDAADLVFAAIADHQGKLPPKDKMPAMMGCLNLIATSSEKHVGYFAQLNDTRNSLKHASNLPNIVQWASVGEDTAEKLSAICVATIDAALDDLDESDLITNNEVRAYLVAAKRAADEQHFKLALEEVAKALQVTFDSAPSLSAMQAGQPDAESALKLTAFGVSANDFLRLQDFLPKVYNYQNPRTEWRQSGYGHPGNWNAAAADFCIKVCTDIALSIQDAPRIPYPVSFSFLYQYKVTALKDQVEVWEDLVEDPTSENYGHNNRPFRETKRHLAQGESILMPPIAGALFSEDLSLDQKPITRVRVSGGRGLLYGEDPRRAEFVDRRYVQISCVPNDLAKEFRPDLPEVPWEPDPEDSIE